MCNGMIMRRRLVYFSVFLLPKKMGTNREILLKKMTKKKLCAAENEGEHAAHE